MSAFIFRSPIQWRLAGASLIALASAAAPAAAAVQPVGVDRPPSGAMLVNLPLMLSGTYLGDIAAEAGASAEHLSLNVDQFVRLMGGRLDPKMAEKVRALPQTSGMTRATAFKAAGIDVVYDPSTLEVTASIKLEQQGRRSLALKEVVQLDDSGFDPESRVSGSSTFNASQTISHDGRLLSDFEPVNIVNQTALNFGGARGVNVFAEFYYGGADARPFRRGAVTLTHENRDRALRFLAGDIAPETVSFQSGMPIGGIGIQKNHSELQPYRNVRPAGLFKFAIEEPSVVEVLVNGAPARAFRLERGQYDLRDFNFASGLNQIEIYVVDDYGRRLIASFSQFFNFNLLDPGIEEFGAYLGLPQQRSSSGLLQYGRKPSITMFYRRGLTQSLTGSVDFQASADQTMGGLSAGLASKFGTFAFASALSRDKAAGFGHQVLFNYELTGDRALIFDNPSVNLEARHRSRKFVALGDLPGVDATKFDLRARFSATLMDRFGISVSGLLTTRHEGLPATHALQFNLSTQVAGTNVSANVERSRTDEGKASRLFLTISRSLGSRATSRSTFDSRSRSAQFEFSRFRGDSLGDLGYRGVLGRDRDGLTVSGEASYNANRAFLALRHDATSDLRGRNVRQRTSYSASTQLAFADGRVGFGRPVGTNFLLAYPHKTLGSDVLVTRGIDDEKVIAKSGALGPALAPAGGAHSPRRVTVRAEELPDGYDAGKSYYELLPGSATGYVAQVGSDASRTAQGNLIGAGGDPVSLVVGELSRLDRPDQKKTQIFTNRAGRFVATGLAPGKYRLTIAEGKLVADFEIGEDQSGIVEVGRVIVRKGASKS